MNMLHIFTNFIKNSSHSISPILHENYAMQWSIDNYNSYYLFYYPQLILDLFFSSLFIILIFFLMILIPYFLYKKILKSFL